MAGVSVEQDLDTPMGTLKESKEVTRMRECKSRDDS